MVGGHLVGRRNVCCQAQIATDMTVWHEKPSGLMLAREGTPFPLDFKLKGIPGIGAREFAYAFGIRWKANAWQVACCFY